ncbi:MAG: cytochrome C oxidase subunit IV family protein [Akkermansiaceae bacterium]|jgi:caa(3)-type oxidase subunit IV|nr:cytochrome C oxidase subunit IV family protein [Akkermansiaceae bacterium]
MADSAEDIKKAIRTYLIVGGILFAGTVATVLVATVPMFDIGRHGFDHWDMWLGLAIATTKASFVAMVFMHLNHEKKAVYWLFASGIIFAIAMVILIFGAKADPIEYKGFGQGDASIGTTP